MVGILNPAGGEESTIEFMENQNWITSSLPIIDETYAYGVVEHPFPLNCCLRDWKLGSEFYQGVKIGIVQYVCMLFFIKQNLMLCICIDCNLNAYICRCY